MSKTLEQGFDTFIGWLSPLSSEHDKAKKHKDSVKSCLENNFQCYDFLKLVPLETAQVLDITATQIILVFVLQKNFGKVLVQL